jgi:CubicO group peptidase (beta-lactamase class C family)
VGGSGLELRTDELARIGRVLRDRGRWDARQLVDATWIDRMHGSWVETGGETPFQRYGLPTGFCDVLEKGSDCCFG